MTEVIDYLKTKMSAAQALMVCIATAPVFLLTFHHWIHAVLFVSSALSSYIIVRAIINKTVIIPEHLPRRMIMLITAMLTLPVMSVFLSQCFRQEFSWKSYDSPSRFLICIPIFLAITHCRINSLKSLHYTAGGAALLTLVSVVANPNTTWGINRITTYFVDPLTLGSLSLTLGLISLVSINLYDGETLLLKTYKALGFATGLYLSMLSGSRTGWLSFPIVIFVWLLFQKHNRKTLSISLAIITPIVLATAAYYCVPVVQQKILTTAREVLAYNWSEANPDNSISMRISFYRMALSLFMQQPLEGWGETISLKVINSPEFAIYATQYTREFPFKNGFHNEILYSMVRYGIWGMVSSISLFLIPGIISIRGLAAKSTSIRMFSILFFSYLVCTFVSSISTEVFNLKFTASFHALMITYFTASLISAIYCKTTECAS